MCRERGKEGAWKSSRDEGAAAIFCMASGAGRACGPGVWEVVLRRRGCGVGGRREVDGFEEEELVEEGFGKVEAEIVEIPGYRLEVVVMEAEGEVEVEVKSAIRFA